MENPVEYTGRILYITIFCRMMNKDSWDLSQAPGDACAGSTELPAKNERLAAAVIPHAWRRPEAGSCGSPLEKRGALCNVSTSNKENIAILPIRLHGIQSFPEISLRWGGTCVMGMRQLVILRLKPRVPSGSAPSVAGHRNLRTWCIYPRLLHVPGPYPDPEPEPVVLSCPCVPSCRPSPGQVGPCLTLPGLRYVQRFST